MRSITINPASYSAATAIVNAGHDYAGLVVEPTGQDFAIALSDVAFTVSDFLLGMPPGASFLTIVNPGDFTSIPRDKSIYVMVIGSQSSNQAGSYQVSLTDYIIITLLDSGEFKQSAHGVTYGDTLAERKFIVEDADIVPSNSGSMLIMSSDDVSLFSGRASLLVSLTGGCASSPRYAAELVLRFKHFGGSNGSHKTWLCPGHGTAEIVASVQCGPRRYGLDSVRRWELWLRRPNGMSTWQTVSGIVSVVAGHFEPKESYRLDLVLSAAIDAVVFGTTSYKSGCYVGGSIQWSVGTSLTCGQYTVLPTTATDGYGAQVFGPARNYPGSVAKSGDYPLRPEWGSADGDSRESPHQFMSLVAVGSPFAGYISLVRG